MKVICIKDFNDTYPDILRYKKDKEYEYEYDDRFLIQPHKVKFCAESITDYDCIYFFDEDFCEYFITSQQQRKMKIIKINKVSVKLNS